MKPFTYVPATTIPEALEALDRYGEKACVLSGGQSLLLEMKGRTRRPEALVSIGGINGIREAGYKDDGILELGAATTYAELVKVEFLRGPHTMLSDCAAGLADIPVRNMGTVGGALCQAEHRFDFPAAAVALGAELHLESSSGTRAVDATEFLLGDRHTDLRANELLTAIRIPSNGTNTWSFQSFRLRKFEASLVSNACALTLDERGAVEDARIVIGAAAATPVRVKEAESMLRGEELDSEAAHEAGRKAKEEVDAVADGPYGSAEFKGELVKTLTERGLLSARARWEG